MIIANWQLSQGRRKIGGSTEHLRRMAGRATKNEKVKSMVVRVWEDGEISRLVNGEMG